MRNKESYELFLERLKTHITLSPPRHFGKNLIQNPLHAESDKLIKGFNVSNQAGLMLARILIKGSEGKFWINGLITRITLHNNDLKLVYYDTTGHHYMNISLEHLAEMQEYQPRDGTKFLIEDEKLVSKSKTLNRPNEGDNCASANLTATEVPRMDMSEVSFTSTYPR